jgi:hypothetical protein
MLDDGRPLVFDPGLADPAGVPVELGLQLTEQVHVLPENRTKEKNLKNLGYSCGRSCRKNSPNLEPILRSRVTTPAL